VGAAHPPHPFEPKADDDRSCQVCDGAVDDTLHLGGEEPREYDISLYIAGEVTAEQVALTMPPALEGIASADYYGGQIEKAAIMLGLIDDAISDNAELIGGIEADAWEAVLNDTHPADHPDEKMRGKPRHTNDEKRKAAWADDLQALRLEAGQYSMLLAHRTDLSRLKTRWKARVERLNVDRRIAQAREELRVRMAAQQHEEESAIRIIKFERGEG
jgi:hypothetical protein